MLSSSNSPLLGHRWLKGVGSMCSNLGEADHSSTEQIGAVESVKAASDIVSIRFPTFPRLCENFLQYAPVSGVVEKINTALSEKPGLLNQSAEEEGNCPRFFSPLGCAQRMFRLALYDKAIRTFRGKRTCWLPRIGLQNATPG